MGFFNSHRATADLYINLNTLSRHDALPIYVKGASEGRHDLHAGYVKGASERTEKHTSELLSRLISEDAAWSLIKLRGLQREVMTCTPVLIRGRQRDRKSTRLNSSPRSLPRMPASA